MKIRLLVFTVAFALASGPAMIAQDEPETELGTKMEKIGSAFRGLRRQIGDASKNADSLAKLKTMRENAEASLKLEPALKSTKPADQQKKFVDDFRTEMKKFLELIGKVEAAVKANKNAEAEKLVAAMNDHQKSSHDSFKKKSKKK